MTTRRALTAPLAVAGLSAVATLGLLTAATANVTAAAAPEVVPAVTAPSAVYKPGFDIRGVVAEVKVKRGDPVKAGDLLMALDDREERANYETARRRADVSRDVAEAEATAKLKQTELKIAQQIRAGGSSNALELQRAEAEAEIAAIKIEQAKHGGAIAAAQAEAQLARLERMRLSLRELDGQGVVRDVMVKPGENVDESRPVVEIVDLDPLYVEVRLLDSDEVARLKVGQPLRVRYRGETDWREAKVEFIDPQADARAGTTFFRLELANPEGRRAGLDVEVQVPPAAGQADAR